MAQRIFLLGIDGLCQLVWERLLQADWAPKLTRLIRYLRPLQSTTPAHSAPAWTSIATGLNPGRHGVLDFWQRVSNVPASWQRRPLVTRSHQPFFWEMVSDQGIPVGVFNYPLSYPPRPVRGYWVCGLNTPGRVTDFVYPGTLASRLARFQADLDMVGLTLPHKGRLSVSERCAALRGIIALAQNHFEAGAQVIADTLDQGILLYAHVITATDRLLHLFWDVVTEPAHPLAEEVARFWQVLDLGIARWLELAQPDVVLMASDHGFAPSARVALNMSRWLENMGVPAPPLFGGRSSVVRALGRLPQIKALLKRLLPARSLSAVRVGMEVDSLDFYAHHAPVIPELLYGPTLGLTLNIQGRQAYGVLTPQAAEDLAAEILEQAISLRDERGAPIFDWVRRASEVWWGEHLARFPDIVLELAAPYGGSVGSADRRLLIPTDTPRTGDHHRTGVLGADQPLPLDDAAPVSVWDVAGLVLHLAGADTPPSLDSRCFGQIQSSQMQTPAPTDSLDVNYFAAEEAMLIENRLRQLGYVE